MPIELDQAARDTLSAEELAAISDDAQGDAAADEAALRAVAGDAGPDDDDDDDDDEGSAADANAAPIEGKGAADDNPAAAPAPAAEPAAAAAPAPAPAADDVDDDAPPPVYRFQLPEDFQQRVADHKEKLAALKQQRADGDISIEEYDARRDELDDEGRALDSLKIRADMAADMRQQQEQAMVTRAFDRVAKAALEQGIDYRADAAKQAQFDMIIKALANDPANNNQPLSWFFSEANRTVLAMHGVAGAAPAPSPAPAPANPKAAAAAARKPDLKANVPDLSQVPGAVGAGDIDGDEFADIDALDGEAFERAIAEKARRDPNFTEAFAARAPGGAKSARRLMQ